MRIRGVGRTLLGGLVVAALAGLAGPAAAAPAAPAISINNVTVAEGDASTVRAVFQLKLSRAVNSVVTVNYRTAVGSATSGTDFNPASGTAIFNRNQTTQTVTVFVRGDRVPEPNETFYLKLSNARGASISDNSGTGTITGVDPSADLVMSLGDAPDPATPGKNLTYTLSARNAGPNPATGVKLVDHLPSSVTLVSASGCQYAAGSRLVTCVRPTALPSGASFTKTIVVKPTKSGSIANTASVEAVTFDPRTANNRDTEATTANAAPSAPPPGTVSMSDVTKAEGNSGTTAFTFRATGICTDPDGQCFLRFVAPAAGASGDTAASGTDYTAVTSAEVAVGASFDRNYTVNVLGDTEPEGDESFTVEAVLTTGSGGSGATTNTTAKGVITNDDQAPPTGTVAVSNVSNTEGDDGDVDFTFRVTGTCADPDGDCYLDYVTSEYTATDGVDYDARTVTAERVVGSFDIAVTVKVHGDTSVESAETFNLRARLFDDPSPSGGTQLATAIGTGTITNDDSEATSHGSTLTVEDAVLAEGNTGDTRMTVHVTGTCADPGGLCPIGFGTARSGFGPAVDDTADSSDFDPTTGSFSVPIGSFDRTFQVTVHGDVVNEETERFSLHVKLYSGDFRAVLAEDSGFGRIQNDDGSITLSYLTKSEGNAGTKLFTFHATGTCGTSTTPCYVDVRVEPSIGGTATPNQDFVNPAPLRTTVSGTYDLTFTVPVNGDTTPENDESFVVYGITSLDPTFANLNGTTTTSGEIVNDDGQLTGVSVSYLGAAEGNSGTTPMTFRVTGHCGNPQNPCYLQLRTEGESAAPHQDYVPPAPREVLVTGDFDEVVPVDVLGDQTFEADETFRVHASLTSNSGGQGLQFGFSSAVGTIFNDEEAPPTEVFVTNSVVQDEGDSGSTTYTFHVSGTCGDADAQCYLHFFTNGTEPGDTATLNVDYADVPHNEVPVGTSFSRDYTVTVNGDTDVEPDEVFTVYGHLSTGQFSNGSQYYGSNKGTITNDD